MDGFSKELAENPKQTAVEGEDMLKVRGDIIGYVSLGGWEGAHNIILGWGTYPTLVEMYRKKLYPFPMTLLILSIYVLLGLYFQANWCHQKLVFVVIYENSCF